MSKEHIIETKGNVLLLNKPFLGEWLNVKGNIGHEIIDFLITDAGDYYIYNNPYGICPDNIWIEGSCEFERNSKEKYIGKYLILTSEKRGSDIDILYVIELAEKLHRFHATKDKNKLKKYQKKVCDLIRKRNIKYNNKYLDEIYTNDDSLYLTFKGNKIYKAEIPITVKGLKYNFQRNKGYIYDDKFPNDYVSMLDLIESSISNGRLKEFTPRSVSDKTIGNLNGNKTFLDLIGLEDNEQVFTNILYSVLNYNDMLKEFCNEFRKEKKFCYESKFNVFRENKIVDGRIDICAESDLQRVIIENKVYSGLNGIRTIDNITQLTTYYDWGNKREYEPLCFILVPDFRTSEIKREINRFDFKMENIYLVVTYGDIANFIRKEYDKGNIKKDYIYYSLIEQIINAFNNLSYITKEDLYARMFLNASD